VSDRAPRSIAGAAVLLILAIVGVLLIPPYAANWRLQSYLNDLADDPAAAKTPPQALRVDVLNHAASLGLPVGNDDVHVGQTESGVKIDVLYIVHVDLIGYTIDLHFRPEAGG
jgi:hypothetical protein